MKLLIVFVSLFSFASVLQADIELKPVTTKVGVELGQFMGGQYSERKDIDMQGHVERRILFSIGREIEVDPSFTLHFALGGALFYAFPADNTQYFTKGTKTALTLGYGYGNKSWDWGGSLKFGIFPYKYNPNAKNLGEYLFRSGTYPSIRYTGGFSNVNSAYYPAEGINFSFEHLEGMLKHEFILFSERFQSPTVDLTPSYLVTLNLTNIIEIEAGVAFNRYIPAKPSKLNPKTEENSYVTMIDPFPDSVLYGGEKIAPVNEGPGWLLNNYRDTTSRERLLSLTQEVVGPLGDTLEVNLYNRNTTYYSQKGIKLMGSIAANLPGNSKIYAEIALLGLENHPFYYESQKERMPIMAGVSFPTFGLLDNLSFEVEYLKAKFANDKSILYNTTDVIYVNSQESYEASLEQAKKETWKWSFFAERKIGETMKAFLQVASDHFRTIDYEVRPSHASIIKSPSDWYYMGKFEFGF